LLAVGTWIWYTRNLANIAAAEIIERAAKTEDLLDLAYCKALMGRGTKEAFDAVLAREAGHPLATFGQQVWFGSHDPLAETADEISPEERAFKSAVLCYQAATRGSLSAAREALDSAVQTLLAAPVLRRRNAVLLYLTAVLNRDQTRQDQALVLLRTQFGGDEFIDEDFLASTAHARPQAFPPNSPSAQWDQAQKAWDEFQPKVSLDAIDIVLQDEPRHMGAIALRGFVLAAMGQAPEAEVWCRDHLKNHTRSPDLYQALAYVNLRRMKAAEAVVNLRLAHALDPTSALTRAMLAHALAIIARSNEAQAMIQDLLGAPDRSLGAHAHFHLAAAYAAMKQLEATLTHLSACLATSPNHVPALIELTRTSELSKDFEGALKALERAVAATQANGSPPLDLSRSKDRLTRILRETAAFEEVASGRKQESKAAELLRLADFASAILKRSTEAVALIEGIDLKDPAEVRKPGVRFQCARIAMRASLEDGKTSRDQQILAWLQGELAQLSAAKQVPPATRRKFLLEWHQDASIQAYRAQVAERGGPAQSAMEELWEAVWRAEADLDG
jgi:tetratricopeptide (TPR) repeat protein